MTSKTAYYSYTRHVGRHHRPLRYLVVGREGSLALGGLLSKLLRLRGLTLDEQISFDHARKLSLYEIDTQATVPKRRHAHVDLMICLNDTSLDYEPSVRRFGTLLLDANNITRRPQRTDLDIVAVPTLSLVQDIADMLTEETKSRLDPTLSSLLGGLAAIENEYPDADIFKRALDKLQIEPTAPFLMAVYRGYDWLQETRMRGKTPGEVR